MSLLDKALEAKVPPRSKKGATTDELQLAAAYLQDHVSAAQVAVALGEKTDNPRGYCNSWLLRVMRAGLRDGRLTLTVEDPDEEDFDKKHEAAKAAPIALGKSVAR